MSNQNERSNDEFVPLTSTPRHNTSSTRGFFPRRGKHNRQDNWRRFGDLEGQGPNPFPVPGYNGSYGGHRGRHGFRPHFHVSNNRGFGWPHQQGRGMSPNFRNVRGSPFFRGNRGGHQQRGGGGHQQIVDGQSFFHPSMLEDPWAGLTNGVEGDEVSDPVETTSHDSTIEPEASLDDTEDEKASVADSMIAQVGESTLDQKLDPAPDVTDNVSVISSVSSAGEDPPLINDSNLILNEKNDENNADADRLAREASPSDSMLPFVSESILDGERSSLTTVSTHES